MVRTLFNQIVQRNCFLYELCYNVCLQDMSVRNYCKYEYKMQTLMKCLKHMMLMCPEIGLYPPKNW